MAKLPITYLGNPVLRQKCEPIEEITGEIKKLAEDMIDTADQVHCIGLSAPQVGLPIRLFVLRNYIFNEDGSWGVSDPIVFINPHIKIINEKTWVDEEGCGSIPGLRVPVERPMGIEVEALDLEGKPFKETIDGLNARVRLHENDHINGVLMIDRLNKKKKKQIEPILHRIKKKYSP